MKRQKHTKRFLLVGVASVVSACGAAAEDGVSDSADMAGRDSMSTTAAGDQQRRVQQDDEGDSAEDLDVPGQPRSPESDSDSVPFNESNVGATREPDYGDELPQPMPPGTTVAPDYEAVPVGQAPEPDYMGEEGIQVMEPQPEMNEGESTLEFPGLVPGPAYDAGSPTPAQPIREAGAAQVPRLRDAGTWWGPETGSPAPVQPVDAGVTGATPAASVRQGK